MASKIKIGPYSAYAIAVKYGYQGTEEEWIKEQEANRTASETAAKEAAASAAAALNSAGAAEASSKAAETAKTQAEAAAAKAEAAAFAAEKDAGSARSDAQAAAASEQAANASRESAETSASAAQRSETAAAESASQAAGSAATANETLTQVQTAGQEAQQKVKDAETEALGNISAAAPALPAVSSAAAWQSVTVKPDGTGYNLAAMAPIEATIRPTVTGNPAVCENSVAWAFQGLKIYGKSTQDGTPSPENPVPIVSAGDGGNVSVNCTGTNKINYPLMPEYGTTSKCTISLNNDVFLVTPNEDGEIYFGGKIRQSSENGTTWNGDKRLLFPVIPGEKLKIVASNSYFNVKYFCVVDKDYIQLATILATGSIQIPENAAFATARIGRSGAKVADGPQYTTFMVCREEYAGNFVPYQGAQTLTLSTPNGLPGIPVKSGGNYTDADGQQWVCNYRDYERGVDVQTVQVSILESLTFNPLSNDADRYYANYALEHKIVENSNCLCSFAPWFNNAVIDGSVTLYNNYLYFRKNGSSKEEVNALLANVFPATFITQLAEPIETPIPPEELSAYRALTTYSGTTVVSTAEPVAGIEAQYIMDGTAAWNKVNAALAQIRAANTQTFASYEDLSGAIREGVNTTE